MSRRKDSPKPGGTKVRQPARDVNRTEKQLLAIELRKQGYEWQEIANRCGIAGGKSAAYKLVNSALKANLREATEDYRELLTMRLEQYLTVFAPKALAGDGWSLDRCLAINDRIERLHNLALKPDATQQQAQMVLIGVPQTVLEAI